MTALPVNLYVTPSSLLLFWGGEGSLTFPGSRPNFSARASLVPLEFARSLLRLCCPQKVASAEQDPGEVGYALLRLAETSRGDFSEGCPYQPRRLDGGPMSISRG